MKWKWIAYYGGHTHTSHTSIDRFIFQFFSVNSLLPPIWTCNCGCQLWKKNLNWNKKSHPIFLYNCAETIECFCQSIIFVVFSCAVITFSLTHESLWATKWHFWNCAIANDQYSAHWIELSLSKLTPIEPNSAIYCFTTVAA